MALGDVTDLDLLEDPTPGEIYDDLTQVYWTTVEVPRETMRLVFEIAARKRPTSTCSSARATRRMRIPSCARALLASGLNTAISISPPEGPTGCWCRTGKALPTNPMPSA